MEILVFETAIGYAALVRQSDTVGALSFGHRSERSALRALANSVPPAGEDVSSQVAHSPVNFVQSGEDELVDRICDFALGEPTSFADLEIDGSHLTSFGAAVTAACREIPWGETRTYGELARQAGRPGAARAVGSVMARNRVPLIVPCHRVVPASGGLGGFSAPQGVSMKRRLLDMEKEAQQLVLSSS